LLVTGVVVSDVVLRFVRVEHRLRGGYRAFPVLRARIAHLLIRHRGRASASSTRFYSAEKTKHPLSCERLKTAFVALPPRPPRADVAAGAGGVFADMPRGAPAGCWVRVCGAGRNGVVDASGEAAGETGTHTRFETNVSLLKRASSSPPDLSLRELVTARPDSQSPGGGHAHRAENRPRVTYE
jgi:hypothetical protein